MYDEAFESGGTQLDQFADRVTRFNAAVKSAIPNAWPSVADFVDAAEEPLRADLVRSLLRIEWQERARLGCSIRLEPYLEDFPEYEPLLRFDHETRLHVSSEYLDAPLRLGRYVVSRTIGEGTFGIVYLAYDVELDRKVAIKVAKDDDGEQPRFQGNREAQTIAKLEHPGIVPVYDFGYLANRTPFIVTKFVPGRNLAQVVGNPPLSLLDKVLLVRRVAETLLYVHEAGVIHRDLKPSNILLDLRGNPLIADFGAASASVHNHHDCPRMVGTPAYLPPEQIDGIADARSDIFSLGLVFYELLAETRTFGASECSSLEVITNREAQDVRIAVPDIPEVLARACMKAIQPSPSSRFQDISEFLDALDNYLQKELKSNKRRRRRTMLASCGSALAIAGGGLWHAYPGGDSSNGTIQVVINVHYPSDAEIRFFRIEENRESRFSLVASGTSGEKFALRPGLYCVECIKEGYGFHQVYRTVPHSDDAFTNGVHNHRKWKWLNKERSQVELPTIRIRGKTIAPKGMVYQQGGTFEMGDGSRALPKHDHTLEPFFLARREFTIGEYRQLFGDVPNEIMNRPSAEPVRFVSFDDALAAAEQSGARLPTEAEYEYAARNQGQTKYPWGDDASLVKAGNWSPDQFFEADKTLGPDPVFSLYSGVVEWTDSRVLPYPGVPTLPASYGVDQSQFRVVRGGSLELAQGAPPLNTTELARGPSHRFTLAVTEQLRGLGFRLARSATSLLSSLEP